MLVVKELIYFISALILIEVLNCVLMIGGDVMNELYKKLYGVDIVAFIKAKLRKKKKPGSNTGNVIRER